MNAQARTNLGIHGSIGSRQERRTMQERGKKLELLADITADLAAYSPQAVLELLTDKPTDFPPFLIDRLVREAARLPDPGAARPTLGVLKSLVVRLGNAFDPAMADKIGDDLSEVIATRLLAPQVLAQRDLSADLFRVMHVLLDPDDASRIGPSAWKALLGIELPHLLITLPELGAALRLGPVRPRHLIAGRPSELASATEGAVELLSADMDGLRAVAAGGPVPVLPGDDIYRLGPLLDRPIYLRADGTLGAPSVEYLTLAASPPSLYVRLARAEGRSRAMTTLVGDRFGLYLRRWTVAAATDDWEIRDLDEEPVDGKIADVAIWPVDRTFLVIVEGKSTLQKFEGQLGHDNERTKLARLYQGSFDQIDGTLDRIVAGGFPADAPRNIPTFGLTVTMEHHWTTVVDGRVFPGMVLPYRRPTGPSAAGSTPCRVISADAYEHLATMLGWAQPSDVLGVLQRLFAVEDTRELGRHVRAQLGDRFPDDILINPLVPEAYEMVADSFTDEGLVTGLREIAASFRA